MMKKPFFILLFLFGTMLSSLYFAFAGQSLIVTAIVGVGNHSPVVVSVAPSSNPKLLGVNKIQNYSLYLRDDEQEDITYTITPLDGYTNPLSGTISSNSYDTQSGAYVNFTFLAPSSVPVWNLTSVTVTLNDGTNLVSKDIHLYIY